MLHQTDLMHYFGAELTFKTTESCSDDGKCLSSVSMANGMLCSQTYCWSLYVHGPRSLFIHQQEEFCCALCMLVFQTRISTQKHIQPDVHSRLSKFVQVGQHSDEKIEQASHCHALLLHIMAVCESMRSDSACVSDAVHCRHSKSG